MADWETHSTRKARLLGQRAEDVAGGEFGAAAFAISEVAQRNASETCQDAGVPKMGPQAVESVGLLAVVLEKKNCAPQVGEPRRPKERGQNCKVSTKQWALGNAGDEGCRAGERRRDASLEELEELLEHQRRLVSDLGNDRSVNARASMRLQSGMQDGDIRAANEELGRLGDQLEERKEPSRPAAASGAKNGTRVRVTKRGPEGLGPDGIRPGQVPVHIEEMPIENGRVTLGEARHTAAQELTVDGTRRTDDGNAVSRPQRWGA